MMKDDRLPMTARETARSIDDSAAAWTARLDRGLTPGEQTELDRWLAFDPRHLGALARARAIWLHADRAGSLGAMDIPEPMRGGFWQRIDRRAALLGGGAMAASLAAAISLPRLLHRGQRLTTAVGEIRRVPLGEGSAVTLDTDSVIETAFNAERRNVHLLSGVAYFEVAHDSARPFVVEARGLSVRAVGTAFSVRNIVGTPVAVVVSEGKVAIDRAARPGGLPMELTANMRAVLSESYPLTAPGIAQPLSPDGLGRALAWRNGMLSFEGETLAQAANRFRRYGGPAIKIEDPILARQPISGLFAASDPRGFARAIAISLDATVGDERDTVHLKSGRPS